MLKVPGTNPEPSSASSGPEIPMDTQSNGIQPEMPGTAPEQAPDENPFANKGFDAGIDADEDADPKNYIEKLTGKLAQKLRDYNGTETDSDLNKFVINSLVPASIPNMDSQDANDVIDKIKDNIGNEESTEGMNPSQDNLEQETQPMQQEESKEPEIDDLVSEILGRKKLSRNISNKTPFKSPNFK